MSPLFTGCAAALVTPFQRDGTLDQQALMRLIDMQKRSGMDALVLLGTTGEPSSLSMAERETIIRIGMETAGGSMPVIVGTGANDTKKAVLYARQAAQLGAQGQLCVTPYYNKATQDGLVRHFETIAESSGLPMILYNVPSRTGMSISAQTCARLAKHPLISGLKEASGNLSLCADILCLAKEALPLYCGNDDLILPMIAQGAVGCISVIANILPAQTRAVTKACLSGCMAQAQAAQQALLPIIRALFSQVSPIPVKAALSMMHLAEDALRLPLTPLEEPHRERLRDILRQMALI